MQTIDSEEFDLQRLSQYLKREVEPNVLDWDREEIFPSAVFKDFFDLGLLTAAWPRSYGGLGLSTQRLSDIASEIAFYSPGIFSSWLAHCFAQTALTRFAEPKVLKSTILEHIEKRSLLSFCATERATGTDVARIITTAKRCDEGFHVSGEKNFITNANYATHFLVLAKIPTTPSKIQHALFLIPSNSAGVSVGSPMRKLGHRESNTSSIVFNEVFVPTSHMIGDPGQGLDILSTCISRTKTFIASASVGMSKRAERDATHYLRHTHRAEKPLLSRHEIQGILVNIRVRIEAASMLAQRAALVWDQKGIAVYESSMAKLFAADSAVENISESLELMGASGYMQENFVSKLYRDAKLLEIYEGASLIQSAVLARHLFKETR